MVDKLNSKVKSWVATRVLCDMKRQLLQLKIFSRLVAPIITFQQTLCLAYPSFSVVELCLAKASRYMTNALLIGSIACILIEEYRALKGKAFCLGMMVIPLTAVYSCSVYLEFAAGVEKENLIFQTMSLPYVVVAALTILIYQTVGRKKK